MNRKEGNGHESIQLPNTFRSRHERERRTHLKQGHHNHNTTSRKPKEQFPFPHIGQTAIENENFTRTCMQRQTMIEIVNHSRSTALERSVRILLGEGGGGLNRFYVAITLALRSAVVYTRHLFSPREGFLAHQCKISENIKIKQIQ